MKSRVPCHSSQNVATSSQTFIVLRSVDQFSHVVTQMRHNVRDNVLRQILTDNARFPAPTLTHAVHTQCPKQCTAVCTVCRRMHVVLLSSGHVPSSMWRSMFSTSLQSPMYKKTQVNIHFPHSELSATFPVTFLLWLTFFSVVVINALACVARNLPKDYCKECPDCPKKNVVVD